MERELTVVWEGAPVGAARKEERQWGGARRRRGHRFGKKSGGGVEFEGTRWRPGRLEGETVR